jgi:hypothetical protein
MANPKPNFFKLDSNIDGVYIDEDLKAVAIPNMIQVVGESDGATAYPANYKTSFNATELQAIHGLTTVVSTSGHGILYDETGNPIAYKGDFVFRDGDGNTSSLKNMLNKVNSITEKNNSMFLRDQSLQKYNTNSTGVVLEEMINASYKKRNITGSGNVSLAARNSDSNVYSVSVYTTKLTANNHVWIVGAVTVNSSTVIRLVDRTTNTVLGYGKINYETSNVLPVYASYFGQLQNVVVNEITDCPTNIWNSMLKKFFLNKQANAEEVVHEIALEVVEGEPFITGTVNIVCFDDINSGNQILNAGVIVKDSATYDVTFDNVLPSTNYSISFQLENSTQAWYNNKTAQGFTINFDSNYTGRLYWTVIHNKNAVNIQATGGFA